MKIEERLSLNNYMEDLYQAMQIGDIVFEPEHSSELYNLINKLLKKNEEMKEDILFCLRSIKQEMEMSTDSRTRSEMESCYEIFKKYMS